MRASIGALLMAALGFGCAAPDRRVHVGPEVQVYPAGVQTTLTGMWEISDTDVYTARVGWNETDREDDGDHDDETGGGPGISAGWRRYFGPEHTGWMVGVRADLWYLDIDWINNPGASEERGNSDVLVLQPTVLGGYRWQLGASPWYLDLTAAFGAEINVSTSGEDVGEGAIGLLGLSLTRGF